MKEKDMKNSGKFLVGNKIKSFRALNKLTQQEVAEKLEMSLRAFQDIENDVSDISLSKLEEIANLLNTNLLELLGIGEGRFYFMYKGQQNIFESRDITINSSENSKDLTHRNEKQAQEILFLKEKNMILEKRIADLEEMLTLLKR